MGSLVAEMRLRREQQLEGYIRWERRVGEEPVRLVVVCYGGTEGLCAFLIEKMALISPSGAVFKELLGGVGPTVNLRDDLHGLVLDFFLYGFGFSERIVERFFDWEGGVLESVDVDLGG